MNKHRLPPIVVSMMLVKYDCPGRVVKLEGVAAPGRGVAVFECPANSIGLRVQKRKRREAIGFFNGAATNVQRPHRTLVTAIE